ncbi:MAG: hypothetical protein LBT90_04175 [Holosporaceae bacterium]|nr:hypothetical protein [Holosporaceae bacterium]
MYESDLILGVSGLPPESARNCRQELFPMSSGEFRKSINGNLMFLESSKRKRYGSIISCKDINSPVVDKIWVGSQIMVGCIQNLWQCIEAGGSSLKLIRPPVDKSVSVVDNFGNHVGFEISDGDEVRVYRIYDERIFVCFRPWLNMYVMDFSIETDEWGMNGSWKIVLEEV